MKLIVTILLIFSIQPVFAQREVARVNYNERKAASAESLSPDTLARLLTVSCKTDLEKVRSIFRWITENISYKVISRSSRAALAAKYNMEDVFDTSRLKSADEIVAEYVLKKRVAICDGYARLFKILCEYAGLQSEVITGYARSDAGQVGKRFWPNHCWNAVFFDSAWHLLDVTWASGYISYSNEFVRSYDEYYFLTPPELLIRSHFPENMQWTLLTTLPTLKEFHHSPFKQRSFVKYQITSYQPAYGIIEASPGDTIRLEIQTSSPEKDKQIAPDPFFDSTILTRSASWAFLKPDEPVTGSKINYTYVVRSEAVEWLHVMYNDDIILRYRLNVKKDKHAL